MPEDVPAADQTTSRRRFNPLRALIAGAGLVAVVIAAYAITRNDTQECDDPGQTVIEVSENSEPLAVPNDLDSPHCE